MDQEVAAESADPPAPDEGAPEAIDFVRFCYRRRSVGWPELYDEMCAVAGRGLYRGYSSDDLQAIGVGLTLFELPRLAAIVHRVVAEDQDRRRRSSHAIRAAHADRSEAGSATAATMPPVVEPAAAADDTQPDPAPRLLPVAAGA